MVLLSLAARSWNYPGWLLPHAKLKSSFMCGWVVQVSDPIRLSIVDGLDVCQTRLSNYPRRWNGLCLRLMRSPRCGRELQDGRLLSWHEMREHRTFVRQFQGIVVRVQIVHVDLPKLGDAARQCLPLHGDISFAAQRPKGYVSGISSSVFASNGATAFVSSNQMYSSNCPGSTAWK